MYEDMRLNGTLANHVIEIDQQAQEMFDLMAKQMAAQKGVTELLKASDQMAWIGAINGIRKIVEELVLEELIYI